MWNLGPAWTDEPALGRAWRAATPFPHLVFDDFLAAEAVPALVELLDDEGVEPYAADLFEFEATPPTPRTDALRTLRDAFAAALVPPLSRITGKPLATVDMRAYAYRVGHYLLPHSDHQDGLTRALAYACYLPSPEPPIGGELELFHCTLADDALATVESARLIAPHPYRLVVFDVSDVSLHQVREVLGGLRLSLAGWFYR